MTATDYATTAGDIFVLSDSFIRIKELIDNESSTIDDINDVIILDPALSGTILKLANSSFFNYPGKIDTISKAVLVLGITEVYNLVIAYFTTQAFKSINADQNFLENFWEESVDCALLVKFLGCSLNTPNAERLFILGILHNLGELIIKQISPDKIVECQNKEGSDLPWVIQRDVLGFTFGECGAEMLKLWQLPYNIVSPIRNQDEDRFDLINTESQLLFIAKRITTHQKLLSSKNQEQLLSGIQLSSLGITNELLSTSIEYCNMERLGILAVLNPRAVTIY
ncbi:HDOD domain-containing protein [Colwellia sp. MSW7]|jgi:HD-like signal output (HDOD) protein|uniref:HDOD domain-containing protein n=1 Tax=Colwellia maritima TaxID=2912588 RepID=A0ABS9X3Y1_9GAMM|nr:HDOD domain-containing protein [Colwellia maritima]MCI2284950.1 HDOD domain-containing protein [Colwellia maritima]